MSRLHPFTPDNFAPLGPADPPPLPAAREAGERRKREVPRKSGREPLPRPGRSKAYQHPETVSRPIRPGRARSLPNPSLPEKEGKSLTSWARIPTETVPGASPRPGRSTWGTRTLQS